MKPIDSTLYTTLCDVRAAWFQWDEVTDKGSIARTENLKHQSFRAARLVDRSTRFLFLKFPRKSRSFALHNYLLQAISDGIDVGDTRYDFPFSTMSYILDINPTSVLLSLV